MGVLLGGLTSLVYGVADFIGGEGARRAPAAAIVLWGGLVSFPLVFVAALAVGGEPTGTDLWVGAGAGALGALGLVSLFAGLGRGRAAAVAPVSAALAAIVPVVAAVLIGESPAAPTWFGVGLAVIAIVLSSWVAEPGDVPFGGAGFGLAAGVGFGGYTVMMSQTTEASALFPVVTARGTTMLVVLILALVGVWRVVNLAGVPKGLTVANGLLDASGNVVLLLALRAGTLASVGVAASLYPAVTVALARTVNNEHLHVRQVAGLVLTLVALVVIALAAV